MTSVGFHTINIHVADVNDCYVSIFLLFPPLSSIFHEMFMRIRADCGVRAFLIQSGNVTEYGVQKMNRKKSGEAYRGLET